MKKDCSSLLFEEVSLIYDDELDKLILEGHTLACLNFDGLSKPTLKHPYTIVCCTEQMCLIVHISDFLGQMSQLEIEKPLFVKAGCFSKKLAETPKEKTEVYSQLYLITLNHH